jgi:hypothetical protein
MRYLLKTQWRNVIVALCAGAVFIAAGCGSTDEGQEKQQRQEVAAQKAARTAERQHLRQARRVQARQLREAARRKARRIGARERARHEARREAARAREEAESEEAAATSECDPSYSGACLDPYASDYDCEGGSGDGPNYTGAVAVVGDDHYELDADGDGYGCE